MSQLPHLLERTLVIRARRETVFSFFTDSALWAAWWGAGSEIDARTAGRMSIRHPNGMEAFGQVVEVAPPSRIVFTYATPTGQPAESLVTVRLEEHEDGTALHLSHAFVTASDRDAHVPGWRFHLSMFANRVSDTVNAGVADVVDRWFAAWNELDASRRDTELAAVSAPGVRFSDRYSRVETLDELRAHVAAVHRFMPGLRLTRRRPVQQCQWRVLADWTAIGADGSEKGNGTNLFEIDADGRIAAVTGFWS